MKKLKRILALVLTLVLLFGVLSVAAAESATATTVRLAGTSGSVAVKNASGKDQSVKNDMRLYSGYTLATGRASAAYVSLDGTKAIKFDSSSKGSVKKSGSKLEVCLDDGKLFFNVTAPLAANESLNIRTSTMVTGIRGSYGWVTRTEVVLIHGHVTVTCINPVTGETRVTELYSGEKVYYDPASTVTGDPKLKEIDFIKEIITNDDFYAFVVDEMRKDESLQTPVIEDVPSVDVPKLLGDYDQIKAAEDAATEAKEAELAEKLREQTEFIENDPVDYLFEDEGDYEPTTYSVTLPAAPHGMVITTADPTTGIEPGTVFNFNIAPDAGYALYEDYLDVGAGGAAVTLTANAGSYDASFTVNSDTNVTATGAVFQTNDWTEAMNAFDDDEEYVELTGNTVTVASAIPAGATLLISGANSVENVVTNNGTIVIAAGGGMTVQNTGILNNYGTITNKDNLTVEVGGTFNNYSGNTLINEATLTINGTFNNGDGTTNDGRLVNKSGATITVTGDLNNSSNGAVENEGTVEINSGAFINDGATENKSGAEFDALGGHVTNTGTGTVTNYGVMSATGTNEAGGVFVNENDPTNHLTTGAFNNYGRFTNNGTHENIYTFSDYNIYTNNAVIENSHGGMYVEAGGTFHNNGEIQMFSGNSGQVSNSGTFNNNEGGSITGYGAINNNATFNNNGSVSAREFNNIGTEFEFNGDSWDIWEVYLVIFSSPGVAIKETVDNQYVANGEKATEPTDIEDRDGLHQFTGWYTEDACENLFDFNTPITPINTPINSEGLLYLYAGWREITP